MPHARPAGRFGRLPAQIPVRVPRLERYLSVDLPPPPPAASPLQRALANLKATPAHIPSLFPMDGNDRYGDCVVAAAAHLVTMWRGLTGSLAVAAAGTVTRLYLAQTGGADSGLVISTFLQHWHRSALLNQDRILAMATIDPRDRTTIEQAIAIFGTVLLGFNVTEDTIFQFEQGEPWTPGTWNGEGHAVALVAYDQAGVTCLTWGSEQRGTWDWLAAMAEECWIVVPPEARSSSYAGVDLAALIADLHQLAGR